MLILVNLLALALVVADDPPSKMPVLSPVKGQETWNLTIPDAIKVGLASPAPAGKFMIGAVEIPIGVVEPSAIPRIPKPRTGGEPEPEEIWQMTLPEAIKLGLMNCEAVQVLGVGDPAPGGSAAPANGAKIAIARLNADNSPWKFQADVMAQIRSIEQTYWALSAIHTNLWARELAVKMAEQSLQPFRAGPADIRSTPADIAEAEQQLERCKLSLVTATSNVITTERQLRNILGLPPADNRRIVPSTPLSQAKVNLQWEACLAEMIESHPDIAQQKAIIRANELQLILARNQPLPELSPAERKQIEELERASLVPTNVSAILGRPVPPPEPKPAELASPPPVFASGGTFSMPIGHRSPLANVRQAQYQLLQQQEAFQKLLNETTQSLKKSFLQVDESYKGLEAAQQVLADCRQRLSAERELALQDRPTIDQRLNTIVRLTDAIANEALHLATYNTSIAMLEESKGTLLTARGILIDDVMPKQADSQKPKDEKVAPVVLDALPEAPAAPAKPEPVATTDAKVQAQEVWNLSLPDAIQIGLDNSEVIRVISLGVQKIPLDGFEPTPPHTGAVPAPPVLPGVLIAPLNRDASLWNFKSAVLAHVRSIEQQYWALSSEQVNLWARETAVKLGEEILGREKAKLAKGQATKADIAEAEQQLENFKLNLVTATSDVITTERQLRNILGLPATDNRRIVPSTAPSEAKVEPKWENSLALMLESEPDLAQQRHLVGTAELRALIEGENPAVPPEKREASKTQLARQKQFLEQVLHQSTHSLARFFLEVDANYKQFETARRLREASQHRLEAQRAFYDEGRITLDRLLDAVAQYANAIAQEAQYRSSYNTSIASLEEAQGTLLSRDKITVLDGPASLSYPHRSTDSGVVPANFTMPTQTPAAPPASAKSQPAGTTYKLRAKFGFLKVLDVELEVCPSSK